MARAWALLVNSLRPVDSSLIDSSPINRAAYDAGYSGREMKNPHLWGTIFYKLWERGKQDRESEDDEI